MIWGGISKRGASAIVTFEKIMDSIFYQEEILKPMVVPFMNQVYPEGMKFMQDNDPKHVSKSTKKFMEDNGINWWPTPPESPDLNPIEMLWNELKNYCEFAQTKEELQNKIMEFWNALTPERCTAYINHIHKVLPIVVEKNGEPSGH